MLSRGSASVYYFILICIKRYENFVICCFQFIHPKKENDHPEDKLNLVNAQPIVWYTYQYYLLKQRFQLPLGLNGAAEL